MRVEARAEIENVTSASVTVVVVVVENEGVTHESESTRRLISPRLNWRRVISTYRGRCLSLVVVVRRRG